MIIKDQTIIIISLIISLTGIIILATTNQQKLDYQEEKITGTITNKKIINNQTIITIKTTCEKKINLPGEQKSLNEGEKITIKINKKQGETTITEAEIIKE